VGLVSCAEQAVATGRAMWQSRRIWKRFGGESRLKGVLLFHALRGVGRVVPGTYVRGGLNGHLKGRSVLIGSFELERS